MIDTVHFNCSEPMRAKNIPQGTWVKTGFHNLDNGGNTGLRALLTRRDNCYAYTQWEVSLPKVIFPNNGKLISSQEDLDRAIKNVWELLGQHAEISSEKGRFTRVDLCWQFAICPQLFILAHRHSNHPLFRGNVNLWRDKYRITGIEFKSKSAKSLSKIKIYDKTDRKVSRTRKVTRVEIQLQARALRQHLNGGREVTHLDINRAYDCYRKILLGFDPAKTSPVPATAKLQALLMHAEKAGYPLFDYYSRSLSNQQIYRIRRGWADVSKKMLNFDWEELLPPTFPPKRIEPGTRRYRFNF